MIVKSAFAKYIIKVIKKDFYEAYSYIIQGADKVKWYHKLVLLFIKTETVVDKTPYGIFEIKVKRAFGKIFVISFDEYEYNSICEMRSEFDKIEPE